MDDERRQNLITAALTAAVGFILIAIFLSMVGCATTAPARASVYVPGITVHVVGSAAETPCRARGCAWASQIWVVGRQWSGGIMVDELVLGHELQHVLRFFDQRFADPD